MGRTSLGITYNGLAMKRCRLKRYNFQNINKMIKENKTSDKHENGNDFIADVVSSACKKTEIIEVLNNRRKQAFDKQFHKYENNEMKQAIDIINRLLPDD